MKNKLPKGSIARPPKLSPLINSIRKFTALSGLTLVSSGATVLAEAQINPNEVWFSQKRVEEVCVKDLDQDGDLDIFTQSSEQLVLFKNSGTVTSPAFTQGTPFLSNPSAFKLNKLGVSSCGNKYESSRKVLVDIDADGDLDLFTSGGQKDPMRYEQNNGTTEIPDYVDKNPTEFFGFPDKFKANAFIFIDFDGDGDQDFFSGRPSFDTNYTHTYYENTGTAEKANFIERPNITPWCSFSTLKIIADFNNDGQRDLLCHNPYGQSIDYMESSVGSYLPSKALVKVELNQFITNLQLIKSGNEGHLDIIALSSGGNTVALYPNISTSDIPQFGPDQNYVSLPHDATTTFFSDLDGDNDLDLIFSESGSFRLSYAVNIGTHSNPQYEFGNANTATEITQCNNSLIKIGNDERFHITKTHLVDIDGDDDLDLFVFPSFSYFGGKSTVIRTLFCENKGTPTAALFASGILHPFGIKPFSWSYNNRPYRWGLFFADLDGDGDQDLQIRTDVYNNIGNAKKPSFHHRSNPFDFNLFYDNYRPVDINNDGIVDSILYNNRLIYKALEAAKEVGAVSGAVFAINRQSQVQLRRRCCDSVVIVPTAAKEISLASGDFNADGQKDSVLAMIDATGHIKVDIFDHNLKLIGGGSGGIAHSISVSTGQLDNDAADEGVISFVQPDGRVIAVGFNLDGTLIGTAVANKGIKPRIDIGKSAETQIDGTTHAYVLTYLNSENKIETVIFRPDGTRTHLITGEESTFVSVKTADINPTIAGDEIILSLVRPDGVVALIGLSANGEQLGEVVRFIAQQPIVSSTFPTKENKGLTVSLIREDQKPALVFLDNQGKYLTTRVGTHKATVATHLSFGGDKGDTWLIYIDEEGIPRREFFTLE